MRYAVNKEQVASRTLDDGAVVIHYGSGFYYSLNRTGTFLWTMLSEREMTAAELSIELAREYSLNSEDVVQDLQKHLDELAAENLLVATEVRD